MEPLWTPDPARRASTRMGAFLQWLDQARNLQAEDYAALHRWSVQQPGAFWQALWEFTGVEGSMGTPALLDGRRMPGARWFPGATLNFAENLLRRRDQGPAIVFRREDGRRRVLAFRELYAEVARLQGALKEAGLAAGDRVAAFVPNLPEAVAMMLAVTSLGGIWSSCSPDFGVAGVLDRFGQIEPRFLLAADGYLYKGHVQDSLEKLGPILEGLPTVQQAIVVPFVSEQPDLSRLPRAVAYPAFLAGGAAAEAEFPRFPFDQPVYILYSSGTTGKPKCIVHGAGGTLLQHLKEHQLHCDLASGDQLFYFTTTGWMMWNWLVTGLASGATIHLYEGNPFHPGPEALWTLAQEEGLTVFGTSAKYLDACKKAGLAPARTHDLQRLRLITSTGSPLVPESFDYVYREVQPRVQLASISGGTDIISCFVLGCPILPVHRGEIQCRGLGMRVEVWNEAGRPVVGEPGELVCTAPFPSMPVRFWNDPDGAKYRAAYFEHYPGVWRHGDWVAETERGGYVIYGRSDATLNPGGVRIGTAEIYRQVEQVEAVEESIVVGRDTGDGDQEVLLFVRLREGQVLDEALRERIRRDVRRNASPRHVPAAIHQVTDIPRTRSGKISEIAVRDVVHGRPVKNTEALANPEALEQFRLPARSGA